MEQIDITSVLTKQKQRNKEIEKLLKELLESQLRAEKLVYGDKLQKKRMREYADEFLGIKKRHKPTSQKHEKGMTIDAVW